MPALPFVQVRDLPPSASFYSAVSQPLGLRFLSANGSSIIFGNTSSNPGPVFEVRAAPPARPTRMILSVGSSSVVSAFYAAARRANPTGNSNILLRDEDSPASGENRAAATDLEGNMIEVVYLGQSGFSAGTQILDWDLDVVTMPSVARSVADSAAPSRPAMSVVPGPDEGMYSYFKRSLTMTTVETNPTQKTNDSKGLSTGAMFGMLGAVAAGAAVGAGITYALSKNDRNRAPRQEFDAPPFQRRATYPEPHSDQRPCFVERAVERIHYPEKYPNNHPPGGQTSRQPQPADPVVEVDDRTSRHTTGPRTRSAREPLMITDAEHRSNVGTEQPRKPEADHRSQVGSRYTSAKSQAPSKTTDHRSQAGSKHTSKSKAYSQAPDQRSHVSTRSKHRDADAETFVSARSEKSASTVRPAKTSPKAPGNYSSAAAKSRTPSKVNWDDIDDSASVEPSDSISCVGERPKPHPRDIPFLQTRERLIIQ